MMNVFDQERERIRLQHESGEMGAKEFRRLSRAIDRAQKFDNEFEVRHGRAVAAQERHRRTRKLAKEQLRARLQASTEIWS